MVGAHQNFNGSSDPTTPFQGRFVIHRQALPTINLSTKSELSISTHYENMKGDTQYRKRGWFGVVRGH